MLLLCLVKMCFCKRAVLSEGKRVLNSLEFLHLISYQIILTSELLKHALSNVMWFSFFMLMHLNKQTIEMKIHLKHRGPSPSKCKV